MISVRMLTKAQVLTELRKRRCEFLLEETQDGYYGDSYWKTEWGWVFLVPQVGPDKYCPEHRFGEILAALEKLSKARQV